MIHEFKQLLEAATLWHDKGHQLVLATVVALEGSSYRRPGVRMLLNDQGEAFGAVSGGCVEKDVHRQAKSVFQTGKPKMMQYDGRIRLGCEGILYLLLEPFIPQSSLLSLFEKAWQERKSVEILSSYSKVLGEHDSLGSIFAYGDIQIPLGPMGTAIDSKALFYSQTLAPVQQLYIFGAEHDAVALCASAHQIGWEVFIVAAPDEQKSKSFFPGCSQLFTPLPDAVDTHSIDDQTAVILMSHSFTKDLQYLIALRNSRPAYLGLLGPSHRRERLLSSFLERFPEIDSSFLDLCYGPTGINIGAESAQEIALSIIAEILSVTRNSVPHPLRQKSGRIHE